MTNQEAIKIIEDECEHIKSHLKCKGKAEEYYKELGDMCIAFYMAINALEQEPKYCDRNICIKNEYNGIGCDECEVTKSQEPKTGHWIPTYGNVMCSVCGSVKDSRNVGKATHYCDFCGAKMVEPQERSDKE